MPSVSDRILAQLEADGPPCPVCRRPVRPSLGPVKILTFQLGDGERVALMPVHRACTGEAQRLIRAGIDAVRARARRGLIVPWDPARHGIPPLD